MNVTLRVEAAIAEHLPALPGGRPLRLTLIDGLSLAALLEGLHVANEAYIATLLNGELVAAHRRHLARLADGDLITLVHAAAAG